ncbi:MAG: MarR family transcriptional regulator [Clostridia bacterium]|nr:MarR family transcriptional regulator [Clostridia bacterium]
MDKYYAANAELALFCKNYMDFKKDLPIRPSEMGVLNIITVTKQPHTPVILAKMLGVSKPMITAYIRSLESKGYITKEPSLQDKRVYYILPTPKAEELVRWARIGMNARIDLLIDALGDEEFQHLLQLVSIANETMREHNYGSER